MSAKVLDLEALLVVYEVSQVDDFHIDCNPRVAGLKNWWWVSNDDGVYAYFNQEASANRWRLAEINRRLNG